jgi:hypothetical protein
VLFPAETNHTIAAIATADVNFCLVVEHSIDLRSQAFYFS